MAYQPTKLMTANSGRGKELQELLRHELDIPQNVKWFEVRFEVGECVMVRCEYHAVEPQELPK